MSIRTDLALEQAQALTHRLPQGVTMEEYEEGDASVIRVVVESKAGSDALGKPRGTYVTVEGAPFGDTTADSEDVVRAAARELAKLLPAQGAVLVIGLGNHNITPDALGPKVVGQVIVTRHLDAQSAHQAGLEGLRPVAALAPGVLGQTGIEAGELARTLAGQLHPAAVVAIDALAAREPGRLGRTIQLSDAGIVPGSGVEGGRQELSRATLGVPVIALGVPTVIDTALFSPDDAEGERMMVTPHHIDLIIGRCAQVMALALNLALQPALSPEDVRFLMS